MFQKQIVYRYTKYIRRPVTAFFRMPGSRGFGILLIIFALTIGLAVTD